MIDLAAHGLVAPATAPRGVGGTGTVAALLDDAVATSPDALALVGRGGRFTMAELDAEVDRAAGALSALGVGAGDRVAMSLPNDVDIVVGFLAAMRLGAIWLGINRPLAPPEKAYMLRDAQVEVLLADADVAAAQRRQGEVPDLREIVEVGEWRERVAAADAAPRAMVDPLAPAAIAYTSGTTGFPKGAVHSQHNMLVPGRVSAVRGTHPDGGVMGVALPLTILNLIVLGPCMTYQCGLSLVCMDRVDGVGMAEWIAAERITTFSAVPAMVHDLLTNPDVTDEMLTSIQGIGVGGADMPDAFRRLYEERFGVRVGTGYGLTEAPTAVTVEDVTEPPVEGSCGKALPQCSVRILDDDGVDCAPGEPGEVCVGTAADGPFADVWRPMLGYWNRADATAEALRGGLLHTGDIGSLDADGNLRIHDRKNDLIIRGGANVYPAEVERVLHESPAVAACAVIGVPDDRLGERVVAFVELMEDSAVSEADLIALCGEHLARYKVPDAITFVDAFARTPMGKIKKTPLRASTGV
ncbi:MAG: AMP-dependent synthetase [Acidimicrobiales bacterium]|nr:MAG: AMP-dependent synthetase [Acidimicrobiales bacterium]